MVWIQAKDAKDGRFAVKRLHGELEPRRGGGFSFQSDLERLGPSKSRDFRLGGFLE